MRDEGWMLQALCKLICLRYIGRLRSFRTLGNLELYLLSRTKRFETVPRNPRIVYKYIVSTGLLNEPISLFCVKPFHNPFCQDFALLFQKDLYPPSQNATGFKTVDGNARWVPPRSSLGAWWGMLRRVPPFKACGGTMGFSPLGSTAAFDITKNF